MYWWHKFEHHIVTKTTVTRKWYCFTCKKGPKRKGWK